MAKIGAVVLAAGCSVRFGASNKLLAEIDGRPLIRTVAEAMTQGGIVSEIVVVTGYDQRLIERALDGLQLRFAHNPDWSKGMGSSIAIGVSAVGANLDGAFIMPGDMPLAPAALLERLIEEFVQTQGTSIIFPTTASGAQRNPVLWPRRFFGLLTSLTGPEGGKRAFNALGGKCCKAVLVADDRVFKDVDTTEDLARARSRFGRISMSGATPTSEAG
jgi:molybdenum cofactor cytidylyltransferase